MKKGGGSAAASSNTTKTTTTTSTSTAAAAPKGGRGSTAKSGGGGGAPKSSSSSSSSSSSGGDVVGAVTAVKAELNGIVVVDSYSKECFTPTAAEFPIALAPVCNTRLLDYVIEFLASNGVHNVYLLYSKHHELIEAYIGETQKWKGIVVPLPCVTELCTLGDAMREVYSRNIFTSDFVLVYGDVVANIDLQQVVTEHKGRHERDKNNILTMVYKSCSPSHPTRVYGDDIVIGVSPLTSQIIFYDDKATKNVTIDVSYIETHKQVMFHNNLMDCGIAICAPVVLSLFQDNFDYSCAADLLRGVLESDIMGYKLFTHIVTQAYAARVRDWYTYNSVSQDIIRRWTFPLVPDSNIMRCSAYTLSRQFIYKDKDAIVSRNALITGNTVIGKGTEIGPYSRISMSVIGSRCRVGSNVVIENSYIWDDVTIGDNVKILQSVICSGVLLHNNCTVDTGSCLSFKVVIGEGMVLNPQTKLVHPGISEEVAEEWGAKLNETPSVATSNTASSNSAWQWIDNAVWDTTVIPFAEQADNASESDESESEEEETGAEEAVPEFSEEVNDLVSSVLSGECPRDNFQLQLNGLKFAHDKNFAECADAVLRAIITDVMQENEELTDPKKLSKAINSVITNYSDTLLKPCISSRDDQIDLIFCLMEIAKEDEKVMPTFQYILWGLNQEAELVDEDAVWKWKSRLEEEQTEAGEAEDEDEDTSNAKFLQVCSDFFKWLREAEEDDD
ncbi:translation initiation factor eIF-2B subunit epsilon [Pelomyxa schiedti]|nr:translation initiation factor eIF-2B subunit epsilon [Pelomyxa schiedti]